MKQWSWFKVVLCIVLIVFSIPLFARSYSSSSSSSGGRNYSSSSSGSSRSYSSSGSSYSSKSYSTPKTYSNSSGTSRSYSSSPSQTQKTSTGNVYNSSGTSRSYSTPANSTPVNYYSPNSASSLSQPITNVKRSTTARRPVNYTTPQTVVYSDSGNGLLTGLVVGNMMSNHGSGYYQQPYNAQVATPVVNQQATVSPDKVGPFKENVAKIVTPTSATHKVTVAFMWIAAIVFAVFITILGYKIYKKKTRVRVTRMSY